MSAKSGNACCLLQVLAVILISCVIRSAICFRRYGLREGTAKIRPDMLGVELGDYRFGLGDPYVIFYERDNYRGAVHFQKLTRKCKNLPTERQNWASSVDVQRRCISVCDGLDCTGKCSRIIADPDDPNNKGVSKLSRYDLNDKVKSVKFCYP